MMKEKTTSPLLQFVKNWTLPLAMASGTLLYTTFANIPWLDGAAHFFAPLCDAFLPFFMFLILFVTFCKVDFRKLRPTKWHLWIGLIQIVFVTVITAFLLLFPVSRPTFILAESILTCVIGPCAAAAPVVTAKLGGKLEEMTTYTFLSNFITATLIPICFPLIEKSAHITFAKAFLTILYEVCIVLVLPMLLAFIVKHSWKRGLQWIVRIKDLSYYLWACSLMMVTGTTVKNIAHAETSLAFLITIALASLLCCLLQFATGRCIGRHFQATIEAGQALGQKNTAFAIWIAYTYLSPLSSVGPGCYILWQNTINSIQIWLCRKKGAIKST